MNLHQTTVHVDEAQGLVAIEWPDRPGVTVVERDWGVTTWDRPTVPAGKVTLEAPKGAPLEVTR